MCIPSFKCFVYLWDRKLLCKWSKGGKGFKNVVTKIVWKDENLKEEFHRVYNLILLHTKNMFERVTQ